MLDRQVSFCFLTLVSESPSRTELSQLPEREN